MVIKHRIFFLVSLALALVGAAGDRFIKNPTQDKDLKMCVNDGGSEVCPLAITGSTSEVGIKVKEDETNDCDSGNLCSGTYTPVDTFLAGPGCSDAADVTPAVAMFVRFGDMVFVSGNINANGDSASTCRFKISIPISSNFTVAGDTGGACGVVNGGTVDTKDCAVETGGGNPGFLVFSSNLFSGGGNQLNFQASYKIN